MKNGELRMKNQRAGGGQFPRARENAIKTREIARHASKVGWRKWLASNSGGSAGGYVETSLQEVCRLAEFVTTSFNPELSRDANRSNRNQRHKANYTTTA
jgi:hypothetical protein